MVSRRMLLVDSVPASKRAEEVLAESGWSCDSVPDVESALRAIETQRYDLVVADVHAADHGGLWLLRQIRVRKPTVRGVLIAPARSSSTERLAGDVTVDAVIYRPIDDESLSRVVRELLVAFFDAA
jgi:DNA-binding response OmpR family regulator